MRNLLSKGFYLILLLFLFQFFSYSADGQWVLKRTSYSPQSGNYKFENRYSTEHYSVSTGSATCMKKGRKTTRNSSGNSQVVPEYSWNFSWNFNSPPHQIVPGKKYSLKITGSGNGRKFFSNARPRGYISYKTRGGKITAESGGNAHSGVVLTDRIQRKSQSFTFEIPEGTENNSYYEGKVKISAGFSNCYVTWEYVFSRGSVVEEEDKVPKINKVLAKLKHITRTEAEIYFRADIKYGRNFTPGRRGDIQVFLRIGGAELTLKPYQPGFSFSGSHIIVSGKMKTKSSGHQILSVELLEKRIKNPTNRNLHYQDTFRKKIFIAEPTAEILGVSGPVTVCRINEITRDTGVITHRRGSNRRQGINEKFEDLNSKWLYEGDKVSLIGKPPSSISLEWNGGVRGKAYCDNGSSFNPKSGVFTIGLTRGYSGEITNRWSRTWGENFQVLFGMGVNKARSELQDRYVGNPVKWVLKKIPRVGAGLSRIYGNLGVFSWHAGDTVHSDITYIDVKSLIHIQAGENGNLEISTLSGNPDYYYNSGRSRIAIPAGKMIIAQPPGPVKRENFNPSELNRWWDRIKYTSWDAKRGGAGSGLYFPALRSNVTDIRFYEGVGNVPSREREYRLIFPSPKTRYIWWELKMEHDNSLRKIDFQIQAVWKTFEGVVINKKTERFFIPSNKKSTYYSSGVGGDQFNNWKPGKYILELYINGRHAGRSMFEVTASPDGGVRIPSLNSRVKDIRFYEGNGQIPLKDRSYRLIFNSAGTRYIWWELKLGHQDNKRRTNFAIKAVWKTSEGKVLHRSNHPFYVPANKKYTYYSGDFGAKTPGNWKPGRYFLDLYINKKNVASGMVMVTAEKNEGGKS